MTEKNRVKKGDCILCPISLELIKYLKSSSGIVNRGPTRIWLDDDNILNVKAISDAEAQRLLYPADDNPKVEKKCCVCWSEATILDTEYEELYCEEHARSYGVIESMLFSRLDEED